MHKGKSMKRLTQGEDNHPQAMELGLRGNQPYWHLDLRHLALKIVGKHTLLFRPLCGTLLC